MRWLERLGVSEARFSELRADLQAAAGARPADRTAAGAAERDTRSDRDGS